MGFGTPLIEGPSYTASINIAKPQDMGMATGLTLTISMMGALVGFSITASILYSLNLVKIHELFLANHIAISKAEVFKSLIEQTKDIGIHFAAISNPI